MWCVRCHRFGMCHGVCASNVMASVRQMPCHVMLKLLLRYGNFFPSTFPEVLLAHASQMTGQLSQSMQIRRARDSINAMLATIISESDTEHRKLRSSEHGVYRDVSFPLSGNRGYHSNRSVPYRAVTRHHGDFSVMGTILNPAVREATKPYPKTQQIEYARRHFPQ